MDKNNMNKLIKIVSSIWLGEINYTVTNWTGEVIIVNTGRGRTIGLSEIKKLRKNTGMLFQFSKEESILVTTVEMKFPIDIICFNNKLFVNNVIPNVFPGQLITLQFPVLYFLEVNAGEAKNISVGDKLFFI